MLDRDIIQNNLEREWNWYYISLNPNITWDIIRENPEKPWKWYGISYNVNITWDIIQNNPEKPWNWHGISRNPNITFDIIRENPERKWDWREISYNTFSKQKEEFIRQKFRKHFMGEGLGYNEYSLFRELMEKVWHPDNLQKNIYLD